MSSHPNASLNIRRRNDDGRQHEDHKAQYSIDDQLAILRQKDTKPEEYEAFYAFAEEVKQKVDDEYAAYAAEAEVAAQADTKETKAKSKK